VARCADGISPLRNACRTGVIAAKAVAQTARSPVATQKLDTPPMSTSTAVVTTEPASSTDVRRRNTRASWGTRNPPRIWAPATRAADRPATT
jgi:hypothetical protein